MKVRIGHVSNSSTTSFCLYGVQVGRSEKMREEEIEWAEVCGAHGLVGESTYDDNYVGLPPWDMKEGETKEQFEARAKEMIEKLLLELEFEAEDRSLDLEWMMGAYAS